LNSAESRIRVSSAVSCAISEVIFDWSVVESVPLACCTASSRTRPRIACISDSEPSAVCTRETPSWALRAACAVPRI
jgi:hypothetical protein